MTRQFLVDINPNMELPKYELILYRLMGLPITSLKNITNFNYKAFFIGIDEISFNIPAYRNENDGQKVKNEIYDLVDGEYYILLNDKKYFIIDEINERADDDGNTYKEVHAYSREYELSQKKLVDYKADSRILYDSSNTMLDGLEKGVLNYIFNHITKSWSIGNVDADIILKDVHRALDFPNTNLIQVFQELQKTFNCIFKFDTINQKIDIVEMDTTKIGQNQGLYISNGNFIKSLSKNIKYDEVKTRLFVYGKDNVSIQSISPTGQPFLDNFDAFKNTKSMTQGLIDALDAYQIKVENYNPDFEPLLAQLQQANQAMEDLINSDHPSDLNLKGLVALERALSIVQTQIDLKVEELAITRRSIEGATGTDLENMYVDMRAIQSALEGYENEKLNIKTLITNKQTEIDNQQIIIDDIKQQISDLQYVLDMNNPLNFTTEQLEELDKFIRVETYNDTNYTEHNITELYEEGKKMLARISQPQIQFDVDVVDFLSVVECQHIWKKFVLGDIVTLEHRELGFDYEVRLVGYEHDYENNRLNLKFSNTYTFDDDTLWMRDLLEEINTTATAVDFNKHKWDKADDMQSNIAKLVDAKLEEARQNILSAVGQGYLFDDSGLWLYKENPDGSINPEQIRAINNTIALTKDNFNTVSTAITPDGIVAEQIYGKLGKFARVNAEQIEVGGWDGDLVEDNLKEYIDGQKDELDGAISGLGDTIDNAFSDGMITNIEANSLHLARNSVVKEAEDVKNIATSLSVSTTVITNAINNLNTEVNKYVGKPSYPIEITPINRTSLLNAFAILEGAIVALYQTIDEKRIQSVTVHQIILSNENQSIVTDSNGVVSTLTEVQSDIDVFRGITKVSATIGTPILKNKDGNTITFGTITKSNPTSVSSGNVKWSIPNNTNISSESGWIEIPITVEEIEYIKRLTWNKARAGQKGEDGIPAKIVTVAPSHPYFIKNKEGATPDNITLTPNFQNCIYSKWEYNKNDEGWIDILKTTPSTSEPWIDNSTKTLTIPKQFNLYKKLIDVPPFRYIRSSQKGGWFTAMLRYRVWGEIKAFVNGVNIAKNKSVTSSIAALSSAPLINLVDDNTTTFTIINNTILTTWEWVRIDLGSIRSDVNSILHYTFYEPDKNWAVPVKLEVSPDNVNWFTIYDSDTSGTYVEPEGGKMFNLIENIDGISYRISSTTGEQDVQTIANLYDSSELAEDMKNTLKQNFYYNRTKITEEEGIEVYDNLGNKVLQMGGIATGTTQTKNDYGFKAMHSDGSFTAVIGNGLIKYVNGKPRPYHYVTFIEEVSYNGMMDYQLPLEFRNKGVGGFYAVAVPTYYYIPSGYELEEINGHAVLPSTIDPTSTDIKNWNDARIKIRSFGVIRNKSTGATQYIQIVVALLAIV